MRNLKELSINNQSYYFYNDIINLKDFHSNLLKIDKKQYKEIDIYYISYITINPANIRLDEDVLKTSFVFVFRRRLD